MSKIQGIIISNYKEGKTIKDYSFLKYREDCYSIMA